MDLLEAAMKADNLQLDANDVVCPEQSAIITEGNFLMVTDIKQSADLSGSEIEVTTPVVHFDQGVSDLCGSENKEEGQRISDIGNEEIIPVITINKDKLDLCESVMEGNFPMVTVKEEEFIIEDNIHNVTQKQTCKRKGPNKKPLRKRFNRPKRYAERQKRLRALKTLPANQEDNKFNPFVEPEVILSESDYTDRYRDKIGQSDLTEEQEWAEQPLITMIKEKPSSLIVNSISTCQPAVKNSKIHVKKIFFKRDTHRPGLTIGTPVNIKKNTPIAVSSSEPQLPSLKPLNVQNPKIHPIHKLKSVFMECFKKPVSTSSSQRSSISNLQHPIAKIHAGNPIFQQSISEQIISPPNLHSVTVKSDVDDCNFIEESTNIEGTTIPSSKDEQRGDFCGSIPAAGIAHITQPRNIYIQPGLALSRNTLIVSPMNQSEGIPTSSLSFSMNGISDTRMLDSVEVQQANVQSTEQLLESVGKKLVEVIPPPWITVLKHNGIAVCLLSHSNITTIQRSLLVEANGKVIVGVHGKELPLENSFWQHVQPVELRPDTVKQFIAHIEHLLSRLRGMEVCKAVEDFEPFWKSAANCEVDLNRFHEFRFSKCCRSQSCHLLVSGLHYKRCNECTKVWKLLSRRTLADSKKPETLSLKKPFKYLTSPEKRERFKMAVKEIRRLRGAYKRLSEKLNVATNDAPEDSLPDSVMFDETGKDEQSDSD